MLRLASLLLCASLLLLAGCGALATKSADQRADPEKIDPTKGRKHTEEGKLLPEEQAVYQHVMIFSEARFERWGPHRLTGERKVVRFVISGKTTDKADRFACLDLQNNVVSLIPNRFGEHWVDQKEASDEIEQAFKDAARWKKK